MLANKGLHELFSGGIQSLWRVRLKTFGSYKSTCISRMSLALAGFISCNSGDAVYCVWCKLLLKDFEEPVSAIALHRLYAGSTCLFLKVIAEIEHKKLFPQESKICIIHQVYCLVYAQR